VGVPMVMLQHYINQTLHLFICPAIVSVAVQHSVMQDNGLKGNKTFVIKAIFNINHGSNLFWKVVTNRNNNFFANFVILILLFINAPKNLTRGYE